ncbi:MAG TPA: SGNH/GDSL hydrolase family protein [Clostridia bacterium]|nr:SGNH/GDSL hydrolase family protein [Clostridia bacterium]
MFKDNCLILFQGDSITDADRDRNDDTKLGFGYPAIIKSFLENTYPKSNIKVINRGIGGNRSIDLVERWQKDCIELKPDYLSILIGVNDTWRSYDANEHTNYDIFKNRCKEIIEDTLNKTNAEIILISPFLIDISPGITKMRQDLVLKQKAIRDLAFEYDLRFLDMDLAFKAATQFKDCKFFSEDGVHPTVDGHEFIAKLWLDTWNN